MFLNDLQIELTNYRIIEDLHLITVVIQRLCLYLSICRKYDSLSSDLTRFIALEGEFQNQISLQYLLHQTKVIYSFACEMRSPASAFEAHLITLWIESV
jgi:hypothetical protein